MINSLYMENFRSVKELSLEDCRRVNVLLGEPGSGCSTILKALAFLSWSGQKDITFARLAHFCDVDGIRALSRNTAYQWGFEIRVTLSQPDDRRLGMLWSAARQKKVISIDTGSRPRTREIPLYAPTPALGFVRSYAFGPFRPREDLSRLSYLIPPFGNNLLSLLEKSQDLRDYVLDEFESFGLKGETQKLTFSLSGAPYIPYDNAPETLRRAIFYRAVMKTNQAATIVFEPVIHPCYAGWLGECIALDEENQYFVSAGCTYLLLGILEKTPACDLSVYVLYFRDGETKAVRLSGEQISELMCYDPFLNLGRFIPGYDDEREAEGDAQTEEAGE